MTARLAAAAAAAVLLLLTMLGRGRPYERATRTKRDGSDGLVSAIRISGPREHRRNQTSFCILPGKR